MGLHTLFDAGWRAGHPGSADPGRHALSDRDARCSGAVCVDRPGDYDPTVSHNRLAACGLFALFFVPVANVASFALAAAWPEREGAVATSQPSPFARIVPRDALGAAVFAVLASALWGVALVPLGTVALGSYGWGLFAGIPFVQGAIAAYAYAAHGSRTLGASVFVALLSIALTAVGLLALALEGAVCILMAVPIAAAFAALGAVLGHTIGRQPQRANLAVVLLCMLLAPAIMGAETISSRVAPTYMVTTSIDIAAPPDVVWRNVISFPGPAAADRIAVSDWYCVPRSREDRRDAASVLSGIASSQPESLWSPSPFGNRITDWHFRYARARNRCANGRHTATSTRRTCITTWCRATVNSFSKRCPTGVRV